MKCPKCGYHSFDHLENCKKCSQDLSAHKDKFNLRGFYSPGQAEGTSAATAMPEDNTETPAEEGADTSFGFDFLDEEETTEAEAAPAASAGVDLGAEEDLNLSQPFGIDNESVPADEETDDAKRKDDADNFEF